MKMKFISYFGEKQPKGHVVEVDKIRYDPMYGGCFAVRVVGEWKRPRWLSIVWFLKLPESEPK